MNSVERLQKLFRYDAWANERMLASLKATEAGGLEEAEKLMGHLAAAQEIWYGRITGEWSDTPLWPDYSLAACREKLRYMEDRWETLLRNRSGSLDEKIVYTNSSGREFRTMKSDILHHVIIHGQHHRAQAAREMRRSGLEPPGTDYIFYLRQLED
ncbi:MAG: DinB family protein [Balneolaceae bacterium]|nr:DinB family protein [Balneolaceae bacterium]